MAIETPKKLSDSDLVLVNRTESQEELLLKGLYCCFNLYCCIWLTLLNNFSLGQFVLFSNPKGST